MFMSGLQGAAMARQMHLGWKWAGRKAPFRGVKSRAAACAEIL